MKPNATRTSRIRCIGAILVALLLSACAALRSSPAFLYVDPAATDVYRLATGGNGLPISLNPIYVIGNGRVHLTIEEVRPGYIHTPISGEQLRSARKNRFDPPEMSTIGSTDWSADQAEFLAGRELWLVRSVTWITESDPFGLATKRSVFASSIKENALSFGDLPLASTEAAIELPADGANYQLDFKLYEVDGLVFKRAISRAASGGLLHIGTSVWDTLKNTFKSIVGPALFDTDDQGSLLFEQVLLNLNAKREFLGSIQILRTTKSRLEERDSIAMVTCDRELKPARALLYDVVRSDPYRTDTRCASDKFAAGDPKGYFGAMHTLVRNCPTVEPRAPTASSFTFIRFSVACEATSAE